MEASSVTKERLFAPFFVEPPPTLCLVRSTTRSLVAKMLHKSSSSAEAKSSSVGPFASPTARGGRGVGRRGRRRGHLSGNGGGSGNTWRSGVAGRQGSVGGTWDVEGSDIALTDSDNSDFASEGAATAVTAAARPHPVRRESGGGGGDGVGMEQQGSDGQEDIASAAAEGEAEEEGACDIFLEAVSTGGLQDELLGNHAAEVRCPPSLSLLSIGGMTAVVMQRRSLYTDCGLVVATAPTVAEASPTHMLQQHVS